jgi:hypothetical protein
MHIISWNREPPPSTSFGLNLLNWLSILVSPGVYTRKTCGGSSTPRFAIRCQRYTIKFVAIGLESVSWFTGVPCLFHRFNLVVGGRRLPFRLPRIQLRILGTIIMAVIC